MTSEKEDLEKTLNEATQQTTGRKTTAKKATAKKTATKKTAAKKTVAKKTVTKKKVAKKKVAAAPAQTGVEAVAIASTTSAAIDPDTRAQMVAEAAYYRAQKRGFEGGQEQEDWYEGEREIEELLKDKD